MSAVPVALPPRSPRRQGPAPQERFPEVDPQQRHIEIVASRSQKRARPRLLAAIVTVGGLFAILAAQLLLSIATSEGAYEISSLQTQQAELARDRQVLIEQLQVLDAPQHIAAEAQGMGMVSSASTAFLRLSDGAVLGTPVAATASSALRTAADGSSLIPNALLGVVPLVGAANIADAAATASASAAATAAAAEAAATGAPAAVPGDPSVASTAPASIPTPNTH
ncbi:MAG: hypothetical protein H7146_11830 [Burkholderiaceae bacterium]|nr:hypothetical protein [Microbacteriaceae bacterium]